MSAPESIDNESLAQPSGDGECQTLNLLRRIQSSELDAKSISADDRRQLVAYLLCEGYATADMAQVLKVSDRTIERDKKAIREHDVLERDPKLVEQMVGRLVSEADLSIQRIRKTARDRGTPASVRVDAGCNGR